MLSTLPLRSVIPCPVSLYLPNIIVILYSLVCHVTSFVLLACRQQANAAARTGVAIPGTMCGDEDSACEIPIRAPLKASMQESAGPNCSDEDSACELPLYAPLAKLGSQATSPTSEPNCSDEDVACELPVLAPPKPASKDSL